MDKSVDKAGKLAADLAAVLPQAVAALKAEREATLKDLRSREEALDAREAAAAEHEAALAAREAEVAERSAMDEAVLAAIQARGDKIAAGGPAESTELKRALGEARMSDSLQMQILARATATAMLKHRFALAQQQRIKQAQSAA